MGVQSHTAEDKAHLPKTFGRCPDYVMGSLEDPYLLRWWVIPRNKWFNIYLHKIVADDDDRALHDHPWWNVSIPLRGRIKEIRKYKPVRFLKPWRVYFRSAKAAHRLEVRAPRRESYASIVARTPALRAYQIDRDRRFKYLADTNSWGAYLREVRDYYGLRPVKVRAVTLFITGPRIREWGFHCPAGWKHWKDFTGARDGNSGVVGRGCGED